MRAFALVGLLLLCSGCVMADPAPPVPPPAPAPAPVATPAPDPEPVPTPPPLPPVFVFQPEPGSAFPSSPSKASPKPGKAVAPETLIREAHQAAQVQPSARGYFGASAIHRFHWQSGKLYVVYVTPGQTTKIILPPGQTLADHEIMFDPVAWDVTHIKVGNEQTMQSILFLTPLPEKGAKDTDISLVSESGYSFDIHLKVGRVGMFAITFVLNPVLHIPAEEPGLRSH